MGKQNVQTEKVYCQELWLVHRDVIGRSNCFGFGFLTVIENRSITIYILWFLVPINDSTKW